MKVGTKCAPSCSGFSFPAPVLPGVGMLPLVLPSVSVLLLSGTVVVDDVDVVPEVGAPFGAFAVAFDVAVGFAVVVPSIVVLKVSVGVVAEGFSVVFRPAPVVVLFAVAFNASSGESTPPVELTVFVAFPSTVASVVVVVDVDVDTFVWFRALFCGTATGPAVAFVDGLVVELVLFSSSSSLLTFFFVSLSLPLLPGVVWTLLELPVVTIVLSASAVLDASFFILLFLSLFWSSEVVVAIASGSAAVDVPAGAAGSIVVDVLVNWDGVVVVLADGSSALQHSDDRQITAK